MGTAGPPCYSQIRTLAGCTSCDGVLSPRCPHLHRDRGLPPPTSAPGPGLTLPQYRRIAAATDGHSRGTHGVLRRVPSASASACIGKVCALPIRSAVTYEALALASAITLHHEGLRLGSKCVWHSARCLVGLLAYRSASCGIAGEEPPRGLPVRRHRGRSVAAAAVMPVAAASAPAPDRQSRPRCQRARRWAGHRGRRY